MAEGVVIKIDGDASGFRQAAADAPKAVEQALSGVAQGAAGASQALEGVAQSGANIFSSLDAGAGLEKLIDLAGKAEMAGEKLATLRSRAEETAAGLAAAQAAAQAEAAELADLQEAADITAEALEKAKAALQDPSDMGAWMQAKEDVSELEADMVKLNAGITKQKAVVANADAAVKKFSDSYAKLSEQMATAEISANTANEKFEAFAQSLTQTGEESLPAFDGAIVSSMGKAGKMGGVLTQLSRGAFTELSNSAMKSVRGLDVFGGSSLAASAAARGLQSVLRGMVSGGGGYAALAAAAAYAAYKIYDVVSGSAAAREAIEKLKETAESWEKTNVKTGFEQSKGMSAFGLSKDDFSGAISTVRDWRDEVVRVWSDGKKESNDIVKEMVGGFTSESDTVRKKLSEIKEVSGRGGFAGDGFLAGLDTDIERLGKIDKEVEKLLKKKQNGKLSDKDQDKLTGLYDERQAIVIKYKLEPESNTAFDRVTQEVDAALSRGADPAKTFTDAYAAATEGIGAFTDALNTEYDAQYAALEMSGQLFEENGEKTAEFLALQAWYSEQADKGAKEYSKTLEDVSKKTGTFGEDGKYGETAEKLEKIKELMDAAAGGTDKQATADLAEALKDLDETQIVEVTTALASMQAAAEQAGVPLEENAQKMLDLLGHLKGAAGTSSFEEGLQESLDKMFGEGLDSEVLEVYAALNAESLETSYVAWAQGEHADVIPSIETDPLKTMLDSWAGGYKLGVNGELLKVDPETGELTDTGYRFGVDGEIKKVNPETGELEDTDYRLGVDGRLQKIEATEGELSDPEYAVGVDGELQKINPETGELSDTGYRVGVDGEIKKVNPETGQLENTAFRYDVDGKIRKVNPDTGKLENEEYRFGLDGEIEKVDPSPAKKKLTDTKYKFGFDGEIVNLDESPNLKKPTITLDGEVTVKKVNFEEGEFTNSTNPEIEFKAAQANINKGEESWITTSDVENMSAYARAITAYNDALESGDTEMAQSLAQTVQMLGNTVGTKLAAGGFADMAQDIANGLDQLKEGKLTPEDAEALQKYIDDVTTVLDSGFSLGSTMSGTDMAQGISDALTSYGWETTASTVSASLVSGFTSAISIVSASGVNLGQGYVNGILSMVDKAAAAGSALGKAAAAALKAAQLEASPSKLSRKSGDNFGLGYIGGIIDRVKGAQAAGRKLAYAGLAGLNIGNLRMAALMAGGTPSTTAPEPIDYERMADAVAQRPANMYAKGRVMASTLAADNTRAISARQNAIARGYGARRK